MSDRPDWQKQIRPRLAVSMFLAAMFVAAVLLLFDFPQPQARDDETIVVELIQQQLEAEEKVAEEKVAEVVEPEIVALPNEEANASMDTPEDIVVQERAAEMKTRDWQEIIKSAARETVDSLYQDDSMHPTHAEAKRLAGINFAPSRAPVKKPIWENVETDHIGRKILRDGNCYRVLEDWRATYQDIQREFGQYIRYCDAVDEVIIDVDWVDDVGRKYAFLRHKDGEIPPQELNDLLRLPQLLAQE